MGNTRLSTQAWFLGVVLGCPLSANANTVRDCAASTGYALEITSNSGINNRSVAISQGIQVAPQVGVGSIVRCSPIAGELEDAGVDGNFASLDHETGTGFSAEAAVIAPGITTDAFKPRARLQETLHLPFRIISASGVAQSVDVTFHTLYQYGPLTLQAQEPGSAGYGIFGEHVVQRFRNPSGFNRVDDWVSSALNQPTLPGSSESGSSHTVENLSSDNFVDPYIFTTSFTLEARAESTIVGPLGEGPPGNGLAGISAKLSFGVEVPEGFEVVFDYEELLGLNGPQLGVITPSAVPLPPALLLFASALVGLLTRQKVGDWNNERREYSGFGSTC